MGRYSRRMALKFQTCELLRKLADLRDRDRGRWLQGCEINLGLCDGFGLFHRNEHVSIDCISHRMARWRPDHRGISSA